MFEPGTILSLREPQGTEEKPYPYDRVKVVGTSPVQHATTSGSPWAGADAIGIILQPAGDSFAANVDKPVGQVNELYEVESYPTTDQVQPALTPESQQVGRLTPEQVFAQTAREGEAVRARARAEALQHNDKSPEQVLREASQPQPKRQTRRAPKPKTEDDPQDV